MTIPVFVMFTSGLIWLSLETFLRPTSGDKSPAYPEFWAWAVQVCRIVFATSVLVVLWGVMNKSAF